MKQLMTFDDRLPKRAPKGIRTLPVEPQPQVVKLEVAQPKLRREPHWLVKFAIWQAIWNLIWNPLALLTAIPVTLGAILSWGFGWHVEQPNGNPPGYIKQAEESSKNLLKEWQEQQRAEKAQREAIDEAKAKAEREAKAAIAKEKDDIERKSLCVEALAFNVELSPNMTTFAMRDMVASLKEARKDHELRQSLYARARAMGIPFRESVTTDRLRRGLDEAEREIKRYNASVAKYEVAHAKWMAISVNSKCPYCGHLFHNRHQPKHTIMCPQPRCRAVFSSRTAYGLFRMPPEPIAPPKPVFVEIS